MQHDPELLAEVRAWLHKAATDIAAGDPLTEYAWKVRYPGEDEAPSYKEAEQALKMARQAHDAVVAHLPAGAQP